MNSDDRPSSGFARASLTGDSRRKAEIEAKREKLASLRKAREQRSERINNATRESRGSAVESGSGTPSSRRLDVDDLVSSLVGPGGLSSAASGRRSVAEVASPRRSGLGSSEYGADSDTGTGLGGATLVSRGDGELDTERQAPTLVDVSTELFEFPARERVYYTKEVQTGGGGDSPLLKAIGTSYRDVDSDESATDLGVSAAAEAAIRTKLLKEQELERLHLEEARMKEEEERLEQEIEEGLRELSIAELQLIYVAPDFTDFVEQSSKVVERALTDAYDYMKDYGQTEEAAGDEGDKGQIKCVRTFFDEKLCRNRSITALDWSTRHPELSVASYNRNELASNDPDGIVAVWNMHLIDRPEFVFQAQTDVLSVAFSPFHPNLVVGGTYSGQILIWDTRARALPVLKTPLSASGHTHPVYSLSVVGTQNAHHLVSASTDGLVCSYQLDLLARPQETVDLNAFVPPSSSGAPHPHSASAVAKQEEVSVTTMAFPDQETTRFCVGTEQGLLYGAGRYDRAGAKAGLAGGDIYKGHAAPVTGLSFHPLEGPIDFSDLFLSSSMDWTTRLWRARSASSARTTGQQSVVSPVLTFEESSDYVYDVKWHPRHPALFGQVDGAGRFDLYNLNINTERPVLSATVGTGRPLNHIQWDRKDGRHAAIGGADGRLYVYDIGALAQPADDDYVLFQRTVASLLSTAGGAASEGGPTSTGGVRTDRPRVTANPQSPYPTTPTADRFGSSSSSAIDTPLAQKIFAR